MAKEKAPETDFDLGFTPEEYEGLKPNQGLSFRNIMYGDYTFEIAGVEIQVSKGKKPHNMLKVTSRVVAALGDEGKDEIGSENTNFFAGSPQSPDFMKQRLKALCIAAGVSMGKGGKLTGSMFIGKRYDASVVWELSKSDKLDDFGRPKMYVNARIKGERKVGGERPATLNPAAESLKAKQYQDAGTNGSVDAAPWDAGAGDVGEVDTTAGDEAAGFIGESEVDSIGHAYRAVVAIGGADAEGARETLIGAGIDPDGPIDINLVEDPEIKKSYLAKFATPAESKKVGGLPPLNGSAARPKTGTRPAARQ